MDVLHVTRGAVAASSSAGWNPLDRPPRRRRTGTGSGFMFPLSVNRWRDDLSLTCCTAQRRNEVSYALENEKDPETVETEELKGIYVPCCD